MSDQPTADSLRSSLASSNFSSSTIEQERQRMDRRINFSTVSYQNASMMSSSFYPRNESGDEDDSSEEAEEMTAKDIGEIVKHIILKPLCVGLAMGIGHLLVISVLKYKFVKSS